MSVTSSKIPRWIKSIHFKGEKKTIVAIKERYKPAGSEEVITEEMPKLSDQPRHGDFDRAMQRMKVHAIIRAGFAEALDKLGKPIDKDWFDQHLYENDAPFDADVLNVIITTKETADNFTIKVAAKAADGAITKFTSPSVSTIKVEGWNYPLQDLAKEHMETLLLEADQYRKGKSSLGQLKMALVA